jgi:hypothetical protein
MSYWIAKREQTEDKKSHWNNENQIEKEKKIRKTSLFYDFKQQKSDFIIKVKGVSWG